MKTIYQLPQYSHRFTEVIYNSHVSLDDPYMNLNVFNLFESIMINCSNFLVATVLIIN